MPTLFKRSNGFFYYVATDDSGKRRWVSTGQKTKQLALAHLSTTPSATKPKTPRCLYSEFVRDFLAHAKSVFAPGTIQIYAKSLRFFAESIGDIRLTEVSRRMVDAHTARRLQQVSATTVHLELRSLRAAFYTALKWELIEKNPFSKVALPRIDEKAPVFLTREEFARLLEHIPHPWFRALVVIAVLTGLRRSELANLRWSDVDFERRLLQVQTVASYRTKTGKRRIVPLNNLADQVLRALSNEAKGSFVFSETGERMNPQWMSILYARYARRSGLGDKTRFHGLRHSFATWLVQDGVSIYHVQRLLGHSTIKVTEMYSHLVPDDLHRSVGRIQLELKTGVEPVC